MEPKVTNTESNVETSDNVEAKRTRYSGPINLELAGEEEIDTSTSGMGRGRPATDYSQYEKALANNYAKNAGREGNKKVALVYRVNADAVSTVRSRFNTAAKNINVGVTYSQDEPDDNGMVTLRIVAGKRLEGRGRKPGHATDKPAAEKSTKIAVKK
jgi:hypothetical protein